MLSRKVKINKSDTIFNLIILLFLRFLCHLVPILLGLQKLLEEGAGQGPEGASEGGETTTSEEEGISAECGVQENPSQRLEG